MDTNKNKIEHLVVDTTAFLQNAPLHQYAENIYTCQEVIDEVTNKRQRNRLAVLPYDLKVKTVYPENIAAVIDFSKQTGDYASLSVTDLKVLGLTYQLEKEKVGSDHIKTAPVHSKTVSYEKRKEITLENLPGWYDSANGDGSDESSDSDESEEQYSDEDSNEEIKCNDNNGQVQPLIDDFESLKCSEISDEKAEKSNDLDDLKEKFGNVEYDGETDNIVDDVLEKVDDVLEKVDDVTEETEDDAWITPSNNRKVKQTVHETVGENEEEVKVACITTDFSMQNVLKQMNLHVAALDGRVIKQVRTFILRCYACFKTTSEMTRRFCKHCGYQTLKKVAVSVDEEGKMVIHINPRKVISGKGKKFSLPTMKGGKHPNNPILTEDQRIPHNRPTKAALRRNNPLDDDYIAGYSPFVMRDVTSKSAQLGIRSSKKTGKVRR